MNYHIEESYYRNILVFFILSAHFASDRIHIAAILCIIISCLTALLVIVIYLLSAGIRKNVGDPHAGT